MVTVPAVSRMVWQTGICQEIRTLAAKHCQAALAAAGPNVTELTLGYFRDGTPDTTGKSNHILVTMAWTRMAAVDCQPVTLALAVPAVPAAGQTVGVSCAECGQPIRKGELIVDHHVRDAAGELEYIALLHAGCQGPVPANGGAR